MYVRIGFGFPPYNFIGTPRQNNAVSFQPICCFWLVDPIFDELKGRGTALFSKKTFLCHRDWQRIHIILSDSTQIKKTAPFWRGVPMKLVVSIDTGCVPVYTVGIKWEGLTSLIFFPMSGNRHGN
jgi:hypothetical protein